MFLCYPDEWRTGLKALRADSISILKKAFPELVQEVILSPQTLSYVQVSHAYQRFNLWSEELPSNRYIMIYCHLVTVMDNELSLIVDIFLLKCNFADHFHMFINPGYKVIQFLGFLHICISLLPHRYGWFLL
jgi:DCN1-like protein 4/5